MKEFETLRDKLIKMGHVLSRAVESFSVFETIKELGAPNFVSEDEAQKNTATMNKYLGFFSPTLDAHRIRSMLMLAHVFDKHKEALSLNKLLNIAEGQRKLLTKDAFVNANVGRPSLQSMKEGYVGVENESIARLRQLISSKQEAIDRLLSERDQYLAHTDWDAVKPKITSGDMQDLIEIADAVINDLLRSLDNAVFECHGLAQQSKTDTRAVVTRLRSR